MQTEGALSFRENIGEDCTDLPEKETVEKQAQKECSERVILKSFLILCRKRVGVRDRQQDMNTLL